MRVSPVSSAVQELLGNPRSAIPFAAGGEEPPPETPPQPVFVGYATNSLIDSASSSLTLSLTSLVGGVGTEAQEGDLVLVHSGWASGSNDDPGVLTSGYTEVADLYSNDSADSNFSVAYKFMGATPDTSVEVSASANAGRATVAIAEVWRYVDPDNPISGSVATGSGVDSTQGLPPTVSPAHKGAVIVCSVLSGYLSQSPTDFSTTQPTNGYVQVNATSTGTLSASVCRYHDVFELGAYRPPALTGGSTNASGSWTSCVLALRPLNPPEDPTEGLRFVGYAVGGSSAASSYNVSLTSLVGGIDTQAREGDLVLVHSGWASSSDGNPGVLTSGYTEVADLYSDDTSDANFSVAYKFMGETPDTEVSVSAFNNVNNGSRALVEVWRGVNQSSPFSGSVQTATGANTNRYVAPVITTEHDNCVVVISAGCTNYISTPLAFDPPRGSHGYTQSASGSHTHAYSVNRSHFRVASPRTVTPTVASGGDSSINDSWGAVTLALRPAE